ncbi:DoxX family protein [Flavobacteriaceae bacterium]|nr:DoxX family protein [Flavobacteriaceae bacterium]
MDLNFISLIVMILFYLFAGISHFKNPKFFLLITPKWVYKPELINIIIGIIEIGLALGLILETTRSISAVGIIILLIIVFPANVYHLQISIKKKKNILGTIIRLPIQGLLIYWAYIII